MASNSREARRKRILERGSDRLAFITGQIQNLPSPQIHDPHEDEIQPPSLSDPSTVAPFGESKASLVTPIAEDKLFHSELPKNEVAADGGGSKANNGMSNIGLKFNEQESSTIAGTSGETETSLASPIVQSSLNNSPSVERDITPRLHQQITVFAPNQIKSAIVASEKTRLFCAATLAILVVLSYLGFPLLGSYVTRSIITFKPLFLVLLTDVTVVFARLLSEKQSSSGRAGRVQNQTPPDNDYNLAEHMSKVLEMILLMRKVFDAVLMDCSVYLLIIICGLALGQQSSH